MDEWLYELMCEWVAMRVDFQMNDDNTCGCMSERMDGCMDGCMDGWMDGWMVSSYEMVDG